jgi:hypothetical protein
MAFMGRIANCESISIKMDVCVCVFVCWSITLERLERFQPNLVHILLYVCVRILCMFFIYLSPKHQFPKGI